MPWFNCKLCHKELRLILQKTLESKRVYDEDYDAYVEYETVLLKVPDHKKKDILSRERCPFSGMLLKRRFATQYNE